MGTRKQGVSYPRRGYEEEIPTNDGEDTIVPWYCLFVVAFPPLERLGEVRCRLVRLAFEIELVDAALGDH